MKKIVKIIIDLILFIFNYKIAGKLIGLFDYCRKIICENKKTFACQIHRRMNIENLIPVNNNLQSLNRKIEKTEKIKVRIVYPGGCGWNHIYSLYVAFNEDKRYQTYVVVKDSTEYTSVLEQYNCNFVTYNNYDLKEDRPNILIATFYSTFDSEIIFDGCRKYIGSVFAEIPNVVMNEKNDDIHWKYISRAYKYLIPDYWIVDPLVYNSLSKYIKSDKLIKAGSPQFDEIYNVINKKISIPVSWKKLENKKVFLWATDHGINESYPTNGFTVDLYLSEMLNYFNKHHEIGLIFRPHPEFIREMLRGNHFWTLDDIKKLKNYIDRTPNIVWDDTHDYCCAYKTCDALIVDANCSITCSFLITGKPICRLLRDDIEEWLISPELNNCYYYARGFNECISYINMICEDKDPKKKDRQLGCKIAILHFDGNNGERIKELILSNYKYIK